MTLVLKQILNITAPLSQAAADSFFNAYVDQGIERMNELKTKEAFSMVIKYNIECSPLENLYMENLAEKFLKAKEAKTFKNFKNFCAAAMTKELIQLAESETKNQSNSEHWFALRFGRITASRIYDFSKCKTMSGSLVESVLGGQIFKPSAAMLRGITLEKSVLQKLQCKFDNVNECGIYFDSAYPFYGASPDAINDEYIFEIKCPTTEEILKRDYLSNNNVIKPKFFAQMQLQMLCTGRKYGIFAVADPNFEVNGNFRTVKVKFDKKHCESLLKSCDLFYEKTVFKRIVLNNVRKK